MSERLPRGRAHKFGDNINTDYINPAQYMELTMEEMVRHAMEGADPRFASRVRPGDMIVAGKNFGSGSSRETAPLVIQGSRVSAIIAQSYARIFFRNCINIGLPVLICEQAHEICAGDELEADAAAGVIRNLTTGKTYACSKLPAHIMALVNDGGLIKHLKKTL